jgi:flagellar protein FlaG
MDIALNIGTAGLVPDRLSRVPELLVQVGIQAGDPSAHPIPGTPSQGEMSQIRQGDEAALRASEDRTRKVEEQVAKVFREIREDMRLDIFEPTGDFYAKFINADTGEVIKTIPPEALLKTWARIEEYVGKLMDQQA